MTAKRWALVLSLMTLMVLALLGAGTQNAREEYTVRDQVQRSAIRLDQLEREVGAITANGTIATDSQHLAALEAKMEISLRREDELQEANKEVVHLIYAIVTFVIVQMMALLGFLFRYELMFKQKGEDNEKRVHHHYSSNQDD